MENLNDRAISAANKIAEMLDAEVIAYSGAIDRRGFAKFVDAIQITDSQPSRKNTILYLTTYGGDPRYAYKIARLLQETSDKFYLCVPSFCKSAGTLIALGANEIFMGVVSELGPLDVQLAQRDEIGKRRSGMVVRTALEGLAQETYKVFENVMLELIKNRDQISFDVASRRAARMAVGVMTPVYEQIDPEVLGNDLRDLTIARAYGDRLARHGKNAKLDAVRRLIEDYPEHGFIIDRNEASELFHVVKPTDDSIRAVTSALQDVMYAPPQTCFVMRIDQLHPSEDVKVVEESAVREKPTRTSRGNKGSGKGTSKVGGKTGANASASRLDPRE